MTETATLGGGCFWCLEAVYLDMEGVTSVRSGYMGGHVGQPELSAGVLGPTGHVEVVQIEFDPAVTSFADILDVFFTIHDPTTPDRQGNDVGPQYRSVIFYHSEEQKRIAQEKIAELTAAGIWRDPVVTAVEPAVRFWEAEAYHQDYYANNRNQAVLHVRRRPEGGQISGTSSLEKRGRNAEGRSPPAGENPLLCDFEFQRHRGPNVRECPASTGSLRRWQCRSDAVHTSGRT